MGNARMRANSIALALCITEAEFSAWTERLVAARSMDAYALVYPAPSPQPPGVSQRATGRITAERAFEAQADARTKFETSQRKAIVARLNFGVQNPKFRIVPPAGLIALMM
jgi:hypothetical protein